jgi:hypothetical protein
VLIWLDAPTKAAAGQSFALTLWYEAQKRMGAPFSAPNTLHLF